MRLWSLHPSCLDQKGLGACWREALLAQAVLRGQTKGYTRHAQLERFRASWDPVAAIGAYLYHLYDEARTRGYNFDGSKAGVPVVYQIPVTAGQMAYEGLWLMRKIAHRSPQDIRRFDRLIPHPLFCVVPGDIESWERISAEVTV